MRAAALTRQEALLVFKHGHIPLPDDLCGGLKAVDGLESRLIKLTLQLQSAITRR